MNRFNIFICSVLIIGIFSITTGCNTIVKNYNYDHERRMRNAIRINPFHELGYIRLAKYLEENHFYEETFDVLRNAQHHIPESVTLIRMEGRLLQRLGMFDEAEKFYTEQLSRFPKNPLLFLDRAQIYWRMKNLQGALEDARMALSQKTNLFEAYYLIGVISL